MSGARTGSPGVLRALIARRLQTRLAHRGDLLAGALGGALVAAAGPVIVLTLFLHVPTLGGWTGPEVLFCWGFADAVAGIFYVLFQGLYVLNQRYILGGELDRLLLRPVDPLLQLLVDNLSLEDLPSFVLGVVIMVAAALWGLPELPLWRWLLLPLGLVSGAAVMGGLITAFASLGFHLHHRGTAVGLVLQVGTFARYPLDLFGAPLRWLLTVALPLGFAGFYGALWVIGDERWRLYALVQPLVGLACLGLGVAAFRFGLRRYTSAGS